MLFCTLFTFFTAYASDTIFDARNEAYRNYLQVKESMTVRTWLNLKNYAESLENVVILDQVIIDSLWPQMTDTLQIFKDRNQSLINELKSEKQQTENLTSQMKKRNYLVNLVVFLGGVIAVFWIMFLIMFAVYLRRSKRFKRKWLQTEEQLEKSVREHKLIQTQANTLRSLENDLTAGLKLETETRINLEKENELLEEEINNLNRSIEQERLSKQSIKDELKQIIDELRPGNKTED